MRPGSSHASVATAWRLRIAATAQLQYQPARTSSGSTIVVTAVPRQCAACPRPPASHKIAREVRRPWILGEREHRVDELPDRGRLRRRERGPTGVPASRKPYEGKQNCTRACCRPSAAAGRCRAAHARAAGNQRLLARGAAHLVHAGGRHPSARRPGSCSPSTAPCHCSRRCRIGRWGRNPAVVCGGTGDQTGQESRSTGA
jgi:hypothetical protein